MTSFDSQDFTDLSHDESPPSGDSQISSKASSPASSPSSKKL